MKFRASLAMGAALAATLARAERRGVRKRFAHLKIGAVGAATATTPSTAATVPTRGAGTKRRLEVAYGLDPVAATRRSIYLETLVLLATGTWLGHGGSDALARAAAYEHEVEGLVRVGGDDELGPLRRQGKLRLGLGLTLVAIGLVPLVSNRRRCPRAEQRADQGCARY